MRRLETSIEIDAPAQTVWAILDDLAHYPDWNNVLPELAGRTTVGQKVNGILRQAGLPDRPVNPTISRIVGARELRWSTALPDESFKAEHIFILVPADGGTRTILHNNEVFDGPVAEQFWPSLNTTLRQAYEEMNGRLKSWAEALAATEPALHPAVGRQDRATVGSMTLRCVCAQNPVKVRVSAQIAHNHLCGCSKCWKPENAVFAQIAVVPTGSVSISTGQDKLEPVDDSQGIQRQRCKNCGVHLYGKVSDPDHHFYGLEFIHPELSTDGHPPPVEFAAFVSSIIETGTPATAMAAVRRTLAEAGIPSYDAFTPELMDVIAWHRVKIARGG